jgi:CxxC-x17-CxxC domain-containing protein
MYGSGGFRREGFRGGGRSFGGPREMTKIKCSECGKDAEVPFKPREGTPVYCRECFFKKKGITPREPIKKESDESEKDEAEEEESEDESE